MARRNRMITRYFLTNDLKTREALENEVHRCGGYIRTITLNKRDGLCVELLKVEFDREENRIFDNIASYDVSFGDVMELTGLQ